MIVAREARVEWLEGSVKDALGQADGRRVALKFDASWCSMCRDLDREVLKTSAADAILDGCVGVRVDFDDPATRPLAERYAVLDLPTVVFVDGDGMERGRVAGYAGATAWLKAAAAAVTSEDPVAELERALADEPDSGRLRLALAEALLSRDPAEAEAQLERLAWSDDAPATAAHALFLLGRYHHRVRTDPATARFVWRELALRFGDTDYARGAYWWYANAQAELGRPDVGSAALASRVARAPRSAEAVIEWGRFVGRTQHEPDREAVRAAAMKALGRARGAEREQLEELILQLGRGFEGEPLPKL